MSSAGEARPVTVVWAAAPNDLAAALAESLAEQDYGAVAWEDQEGSPGRVARAAKDAQDPRGADRRGD